MITAAKTLRLVALLLPLYGCGQTPTAPLTPQVSTSVSNDIIIQNFDIIGFGNKFTTRRHDHVRKWKAPIRVGLQSGYYAPPFLENIVSEHIDTLRELTGHPIELYYSLSKQKNGTLGDQFNQKNVNLIVYYYPSSEIFKKVGRYFDNDPDLVQYHLDNAACFSKIFTRKLEIVAGFIVLPSNHPNRTIRACFVSQLTQIFGLANDSDLVRPSIFNDGIPEASLTEHDKWMIRMIYDPRITAGMPRELAIDMGRKILSEIRPEGD
ncbi:MAG: DUF2927 domain-containing protein [Rhodospirillales bacterium]|nr:DUF2927 domain-containing protein [Rhodospirillales bacterium]